MKTGLAAAEAALRVHNVCTAESAVAMWKGPGGSSLMALWFPYDRRFAASLGTLLSRGAVATGSLIPDQALESSTESESRSGTKGFLYLWAVRGGEQARYHTVYSS